MVNTYHSMYYGEYTCMYTCTMAHVYHMVLEYVVFEIMLYLYTLPWYSVPQASGMAIPVRTYYTYTYKYIISKTT